MAILATTLRKFRDQGKYGHLVYRIRNERGTAHYFVNRKAAETELAKQRAAADGFLAALPEMRAAMEDDSLALANLLECEAEARSPWTLDAVPVRDVPMFNL